MRTHQSAPSIVKLRIDGITELNRPAFSVQHHPEASPGPQDSHYLFKRFVDMMEKRRAA